MALSNLNELKDTIIRFAVADGEADFTNAVPDLIALAHSRLNRELRCRQMEAQATVTITNGTGPLPDDFLEHIEVKDGSSPARVLAPVAQTFGDVSFPNSGSGVARYFSILGGTIKTYPASSSNLTLRYYQKIEALDEADDETNWVLTDYPGLYVYGSLIEGAAYMLDDARIATWSTLYENIKQALISEDMRSRFVMTSSRVRGPTP